MKRGSFWVGFLSCALLMGITTTAYAAGIMAERSNHRILVDGQEVQMEAYKVNGNNYVKLRDIGEAVGFNVYWDSENGCVQVEPDKPYTGEAPKTEPSQPAGSTQTASKPEANLNALRQEMVERINAVRAENGAAPLPVNQSLMDAAQDCAEQGFRKHDQHYEWTALASHGWPHGGGINLTWFSSAASCDSITEKAVSNWVNSPGHFQTLLRADAACLGTGISIQNNIAYCYMIVGDPSSHSPLE